MRLLDEAGSFERRYTEVLYLRGVAYLAMKESAAAAAEFRKINTPQRVLLFDTATNVLVGDPILIADGIPEGIAITPEAGAGTIPFASISVELNVRPESRYELSAAGTFVLNHASDGIQPVSELVRLAVSNVQGALFDATLSAGSLKAIAATGGIFHSQHGGAIRMLRITGGGVSGIYRFQLLAPLEWRSRPADHLVAPDRERRGIDDDELRAQSHDQVSVGSASQGSAATLLDALGGPLPRTESDPVDVLKAVPANADPGIVASRSRERLRHLPVP